MRRTELACYGLLASAFVLAALLMVTVSQKGIQLTSEAQAEMVISRNNITAMTARSRDNEEALFLLENNSQTLLIYTLDLTRGQVNRMQVIQLGQLFGTATPAGAGGSGGGGRAPR